MNGLFPNVHPESGSRLAGCSTTRKDIVDDLVGVAPHTIEGPFCNEMDEMKCLRLNIDMFRCVYHVVHVVVAGKIKQSSSRQDNHAEMEIHSASARVELEIRISEDRVSCTK